MIKACIFDLDGVIVDTASYHFLAWKRLAEELDIEFNENDNENLKGMSRMDSLDLLLSLGGISMKQKEKQLLAHKKNSWYRDYIKEIDSSDILPGVMDFLNIIKGESIKTAVASSSKNAMMIIKNLGIECKFDVIVDGTMVEKAKPHPRIFLTAAQRLDVVPANCFVFEDAAAGIKSAHRAGMKCIGVGLPQNLSQADRVIPGFTEISLEILEF